MRLKDRAGLDPPDPPDGATAGIGGPASTVGAESQAFVAQIIAKTPGCEVKPSVLPPSKEKAPHRGAFPYSINAARSALHRTEELVVGLGVLHLVQQEFHRRHFIHRMQH
jgi:hypothetical protein